MSLAAKLLVTSSGLFLGVGLLTGVWKFRWMSRTADHTAPFYVDTAHRASFMYSFACLVLAKLAEFSPYSSRVAVSAAVACVGFFSSAVITYVVLGVRNRTDNQFKTSSFTTTWGMWLLIAGEVGGFAVLFAGFLQTQLLSP